MSKLSKIKAIKRWKALRDAVNDWDPVGLIELGAPEDEYECLVSSLMRLLERGEVPREIASFLDNEIPDHFGVSKPENSYEFARRIVSLFSQQNDSEEL